MNERNEPKARPDTKSYLNTFMQQLLEEWAPNPNPNEDEVTHVSELTPAERRYEAAMTAFTKVFSGLREELRELRRDYARIKRELRELKDMHGSGNPAPAESDKPPSKRRPHPDKGYRTDMSQPYTSLEHQLGPERLAMFRRAGERIREIKTKYGLSYKQMSKWMENDPIWTHGSGRLKRAPSALQLGKLASQKTPYREDLGRYEVIIGSRSSLVKVLAGLDNLDLRLAAATHTEPAVAEKTVAQ